MDVLSLSERGRAESAFREDGAPSGRAFDSAAIDVIPETKHPHPSPLPKGEGTERTLPGGEGGARGVGWVVRWACAVGVLAWSASLLAEFGYALMAEQSLARAARAGVVEATLPRATSRSIRAVVDGRLDEAAIPRAGAKLVVARNGSPVGGAFRPLPGDRITVLLSVPASDVLPGWLRALPWTGGREIAARAERQLPSRSLRSL